MKKRSKTKMAAIGIALFGLIGLVVILFGYNRPYPIEISPSDSEMRNEETIQRGGHLAEIAGCRSCHTVPGAPAFAGGLAVKSPFGTFYSPNITPSREYGIGSWTAKEFLKAVWFGVSPKGHHYYPAFPYTSYTAMTPDDVLSIKAYLDTLAPVQKSNRNHDLVFPISFRSLMIFWKWIYFTAGQYEPREDRDMQWNRGRYLANAVLHCGECHTPRDFLGGMDHTREFIGTKEAFTGEKVPNITPHKKTGIGMWTRQEFITFMKSGTKPDFDNVQGSMKEVIRASSSKLEKRDLDALASYFFGIYGRENKID